MTDTPLTQDGILEAQASGRRLKSNGYTEIDVVHTSLLRRSTHTVWLCMQQLGLEWVPVHKHFGLNERNYGMWVCEYVSGWASV